MENNWVSSEIKNGMTIWSRNFISGYRPKGNEISILKRYMQIDVYHSIITVIKITETILMSRTGNGQTHNTQLPQQMVIQELRMKHFYKHEKI